MKDFSLLYGPVRTWLPILAMAVLAFVVFVNQSTGQESDCDQAAADGCTEPLVEEPELLGNGGGLDVTPAGLTGVQADDEPSAWDDVDPSASSVPFVSLQPAPEPMTEAGQDLARSLPADDEPANDEPADDERSPAQP